jgi:hypothetical protein
MKPVVPNYLLQNRIRAETDRKRGIPHLIELREQLDTVSVKLGAMPISTARSLRHKKSKVRLGVRKAFVVGGTEVGAGKSINSEQPSEGSSDGEPRQNPQIILLPPLKVKQRATLKARIPLCTISNRAPPATLSP